jgi:hypothetical protein
MINITWCGSAKMTQLSTNDKYTTDHDDGQRRNQTARRNTVNAGANDFH